MATRDDLLATLESIHAAGLDERQWPAALSAVTNLLGAVAATFEEFAKTPLQHRAFHTFGLPPLRELEYVDQYIACSPRIPAGLTWRTGRVAWDYQILDEAAMRRDVFYSEFLPRCGLRYSIAAVLLHTPDEFTVVAAQRSAKQGHVDRGEIRLMRQLLPHLQQAHDVAVRLRGSRSIGAALERTLDWLADGVALIGADGAVVYANESLHEIARDADGFRLVKSGIEFFDPQARQRYGAALAAVLRLKSGNVEHGGADFVAARSAHPQPYLVSVRPLIAGARERAGVAARGGNRFCARSAHRRNGGDRHVARIIRAHRSGGGAGAGAAIRRDADRVCPAAGAQPQHGLHAPAAAARKNRLQPDGRAHSPAQ